jgi:hypothetical protein
MYKYIDLTLFSESKTQKEAREKKEAALKAEQEKAAKEVAANGTQPIVAAGGAGSQDLAAVLAEVEKLKAENAALKAKDTEKVSLNQPVKAAKALTPEEYLEQRVPVMLYKDGDKYKDDVVLAINGERVQIRRGVQVYVKRKFAQILENQYRQQMVAANLQTELSEQFETESKKRGF